MTNFERRSIKGIYYCSPGFILLSISLIILTFFFVPDQERTVIYIHNILNIIGYTTLFLLSKSTLKREGEPN